MKKVTDTGNSRSVIPAVILCGSIALAALFSGGGIPSFLGPDQSDLARKKQEFRDNRNLLLLQLSICQRNTAKASDAYICPGSAVIYKSLGAGPDCLIAQEVAKELGIGDRDFTITQNPLATQPGGTEGKATLYYLGKR